MTPKIDHMRDRDNAIHKSSKALVFVVEDTNAGNTDWLPLLANVQGAMEVKLTNSC
jgi:hypothetical protein